MTKVCKQCGATTTATLGNAPVTSRFCGNCGAGTMAASLLPLAALISSRSNTALAWGAAMCIAGVALFVFPYLGWLLATLSLVVLVVRFRASDP